MYKKISMAIFATVFAYSALAQDPFEDVDPRLVEHFGSDHIQHLLQNAPNILEYYAYYLDHVVQFMEIGDKDISDLPQITELLPKNGTYNSISLADQLAANNFNPLAFELNQEASAYTYYRIGASDLVLAVLPSTLFNKNYDAFRGATYE